MRKAGWLGRDCFPPKGINLTIHIFRVVERSEGECLGELARVTFGGIGFRSLMELTYLLIDLLGKPFCDFLEVSVIGGGFGETAFADVGEALRDVLG